MEELALLRSLTSSLLNDIKMKLKGAKDNYELKIDAFSKPPIAKYLLAKIYTQGNKNQTYFKINGGF
jgi:hypothetical protein